MTVWRAFAESGDPGLTAAVFRESARRMRSCGINMYLGPVADVNSEYLNPVIGTRAFSEDPGEVAKAVAAAVRTFSEEGILTSIKHFPGHGSSRGDSHLVLPALGRTLGELREKDIVPFIKGIEAGADSVMTAHVAPRGRGIPSSLDPAIVRGILREEIGFNGVIITDGLEMEGILTGAGLVGAARDFLARGEGASARRADEETRAGAREGIARMKPAAVSRTALEAGNDLLLFCRPAAEVYGEIEEVGRDLEGDGDFWDGAFREISAESLPRVKALRLKAEGANPAGRAEGIYSLPCGNAVRVIKDPSRVLPLALGSEAVPVFCGEREDFAQYPVRRFIERLVEKTGGKDPGWVFDDEGLAPSASATIAGNGQRVEVFACRPSGASGSRVLVMLFRRPMSPADLARIGEGFDVVVAAERPWDSYHVKDRGTTITCYGISDSTADGVALALVGEGG